MTIFCFECYALDALQSNIAHNIFTEFLEYLRLVLKWRVIFDPCFLCQHCIDNFKNALYLTRVMLCTNNSDYAQISIWYFHFPVSKGHKLHVKRSNLQPRYLLLKFTAFTVFLSLALKNIWNFKTSIAAK